MDSRFWTDKRVLITGHTGFKGSWLALFLQKLGARVAGFSLPPTSSKDLFLGLNLDQSIDHRIGDIRDVDKMNEVIAQVKPQIVFHLAAQPLVRKSYFEPVETWSTNVMGTINILEALRKVDDPCCLIAITTDKVYKNNNWLHGYRENDALGGHDPYSSSKAAAEIAIDSWRLSFTGSQPHQTPHLSIGVVRSGNVIGGGDWSDDRIIPDIVRNLILERVVEVRNPLSTRPWQHVLDPLSGYIMFAQALFLGADISNAFNFGPNLDSNKSVGELVQESLKHWPGAWRIHRDGQQPYEASLLNLSIDKAYHELGWSPKWDFTSTVEKTMNWYKQVLNNEASVMDCCSEDLNSFLTSFGL